LGSFLSSGTLNGIVVVVLLRICRAETAPTRANPRGAVRVARLNLDPRTRVMAILNYCCCVKGRVPDTEQECPKALDSSLFYPFEFISNPRSIEAGSSISRPGRWPRPVSDPNSWEMLPMLH
jgi:hypothetical protein